MALISHNGAIPPARPRPDLLGLRFVVELKRLSFFLSASKTRSIACAYGHDRWPAWLACTMSMFKRRGSKAAPSIHSSATDSPSLQSSPAPLGKSPRKTRKGSTRPGESPPARHLDDFGRALDRPNPAFSSSTSSAAPPSGFGLGYGVGDDEPATELVLMFGYMPLATTMELRSDQVAEIVERCAVEIRERGA